MMKVKILFLSLYPKNKKTDADDNAVKKSHEKKTEKKEQTEHKRLKRMFLTICLIKMNFKINRKTRASRKFLLNELKKPENVSQKMIEKKDSHSETCKKNRNHAENFGYF